MLGPAHRKLSTMATLQRNKTFHPAHEPLQNQQDLQLDANKIHGPLPFLNPTRADYDHVPVKSGADPGTVTKGANEQEPAQPIPGDNDETSPEARYRWTSRNNRKGRHALVVKPEQTTPASPETPRPTAHPREVLTGIRRMFTSFPVWDCLNAFFALLPFTNPQTEFKGEVLYGGGITAFIGATVFEVGSVLIMLEAVNAHRTGCFGWAVERYYDGTFHGHGSDDCPERGLVRLAPHACAHHHANGRNLVGTATPLTHNGNEGKVVAKPLANGVSPSERSWTWWPSMQELRTHYIHDIGFIACSSLTFGTTVFWISGFTSLPGIYNYLGPQVVLDGVYWVPQVIGGIFFIFSGLLFTIETQRQWWKPAPHVLGWHVGFWNTVGGIGFTLCPIFVFSASHWGLYQASCSTIWGSFSFLIGSTIQWYESLNKHPVEVEKITTG
ncbi:hypothetical protein D0867_14226 [Hortaea werneckii]|uniref:Integral membrane protein n=1 Tax=Hortaea werneckii TaxID=91943 RepID=A0A3M6XRM2_HORWE|nr:hypothetical protein D0867_14226 [Hortaea werneckii]